MYLICHIRKIGSPCQHARQEKPAVRAEKQVGRFTENRPVFYRLMESASVQEILI